MWRTVLDIILLYINLICLRDFHWIKNLWYFPDKFLTGSHMLGSQLGKFLILIIFKQLLSNKIFLGQDKNSLGINL